jgi:23S rRNA (guanine745-N1)-methyltransferase
MQVSKYERAIAGIRKNQEAYACPICGTRMKITKSGRFICKKEHTFDVSKKGYINLINEAKNTNYNKELFESRKEILSQGFYLPIAEEINNIVKDYAIKQRLSSLNLLDVGCGEGYYSFNLSQQENINIFAFDISKEAIALATDYPAEINWCIADLSNLPFKGRSMDILVDVLTPANYKEFKRVLKNQGLLIKVIPGDEYLKEIRELISEQLQSKSYSNKDTVEYTESHIRNSGKKLICYKMPVNEEQVTDFVKMTPMTSRVDIDSLELSKIKEMTISMEIIYGKL